MQAKKETVTRTEWAGIRRRVNSLAELGMPAKDTIKLLDIALKGIMARRKISDA